MSEIWIRLPLVAGALTMAGLVAAVQRRRTRHPVREVKAVPLEAGVFFFSSATCSTCADARTKLDASLGDGGYTEFVWEEQQKLFADLEIDAVPSVLIVSQSGTGRLYPGQPDRALRSL
ncbi:MAG TPA: hypothetical protein VE569_13345 [Acidimicrobiia bacterium]|nr:hypothetical protein [Acidimicrobiia bacterium]